MTAQFKIEKCSNGQILVTSGNTQLTHSIVCGIAFNTIMAFDEEKGYWIEQNHFDEKFKPFFIALCNFKSQN